MKRIKYTVIYKHIKMFEAQFLCLRDVVFLSRSTCDGLRKQTSTLSEESMHLWDSTLKLLSMSNLPVTVHVLSYFSSWSFVHFFRSLLNFLLTSFLFLLVRLLYLFVFVVLFQPQLFYFLFLSWRFFFLWDIVKTFPVSLSDVFSFDVLWLSLRGPNWL